MRDADQGLCLVSANRGLDYTATPESIAPHMSYMYDTHGAVGQRDCDMEGEIEPWISLEIASRST
jgi:hypothetical protein